VKQEPRNPFQIREKNIKRNATFCKSLNVYTFFLESSVEVKARIIGTPRTNIEHLLFSTSSVQLRKMIEFATLVQNFIDIKFRRRRQEYKSLKMYKDKELKISQTTGLIHVLGIECAERLDRMKTVLTRSRCE